MLFEKIEQAMRELDEQTLIDSVKEAMQSGADAAEALEACQRGMDAVGLLFEEGEYFVGDLIYAGEIMTQAVELLKPGLSCGGSAAGKVIICTVRDDLHDIGKNIVKSLLEAAGFQLVDLGVDVGAEEIVEAVKHEQARILALSGVLTLSLQAMADTCKALEAATIRESVKVIVGGAPVNDISGPATGADAWTQSPRRAVELCAQWAKELY